MNKLLVICGPTATGKTSLAIKLCKRFNGEIVSADSRQVYRGMDIGTGKDLPVNAKFKNQNAKLQCKIQNYQIGYYQLKGVKVWLYDIVEPDCQFSVADYVRCAALVIEDIWKGGKLPILVGGTGFYIKAVVDGIETLEVPPDWELREKLKNLGIEKLQERLKKLDPKRWERMNESDRNNPRRLIRAIEIARKIKNEKLKIKNYKSKLKIGKTLFIGLTAPLKILYQRIDNRVEKRVRQGIIGEIKKLLKLGYSWDNSVLGTTIGYKEWKTYFKATKQQSNKATKLKEKIIQRWKYNEHGYARRQMTWFRKVLRQAEGVWFDISKKGWENKVIQAVNDWVSNFRPLEVS